MPYAFYLLKILGKLLLPPAAMIAGFVLAGALALLGRRRLAKIVALLGIAHTVVLSMPPVADLLMQGLEHEARLAAQAAAPCCYDSIVVLGGAMLPALPPYFPEPSLTEASDRVWQAARLYRRGVAPRILVSGGSVLLEEGRATTSEAEAMRVFLVDLGVPREAIVEEGKALNTIQNIALVRELVKDKPVALVTSAYHMPRALMLARRAGLEVGAFPVDWRAAPEGHSDWENWMPSATALQTSGQALWEYMALAFDFRVRSLGP